MFPKRGTFGIHYDKEKHSKFQDGIEKYFIFAKPVRIVYEKIHAGKREVSFL